MQAHQLPQSHALTANRKVCIIDSGINRDHEDLSGISVTGEYDAGTGWWYTDENHHGTHVAGTIAAAANNSIGIAGVAPGVTILPLKFIGPAGGDTADALEAISYAKRMGAQIINASWGAYGEPSTLELEAIQRARAAGVLFVAAAWHYTWNQVLPQLPSATKTESPSSGPVAPERQGPSPESSLRAAPEAGPTAPPRPCEAVGRVSGLVDQSSLQGG